MGEGGGYKIIMSIKSNNLPLNANNIVKNKTMSRGHFSLYIFPCFNIKNNKFVNVLKIQLVSFIEHKSNK